MTVGGRKVLGIILITLAGFGFIGAVNKGFRGRNPVTGVVMLVAMGAGGAALVRSGRRREGAHAGGAETVSPEHAVLRAAHARQGRVTASEVALDTGLPLATVQAQLEAMDRTGACTSLVGESGIMIYRFAEFEDPAAKREIFAGDEAARARLAGAQGVKNGGS